MVVVLGWVSDGEVFTMKGTPFGEVSGSLKEDCLTVASCFKRVGCLPEPVRV